MSASTQTRPGVDAVTRVSLIEALKEQLLQARRVYLKGRAPRSKYVVQLRKDIERGQCRPIHMVMESMLADVEDGIPAALVTQWLDSAKAIVEAHAQRHQREATTLSLLPAVNREARLEAELREIENRALAEQSPDALAQLEAEESRAIAVAEQVRNVARRIRVRLTMRGA